MQTNYNACMQANYNACMQSNYNACMQTNYHACMQTNCDNACMQTNYGNVDGGSTRSFSNGTRDASVAAAVEYCTGNTTSCKGFKVLVILDELVVQTFDASEMGQAGTQPLCSYTKGM